VVPWQPSTVPRQNGVVAEPLDLDGERTWLRKFVPSNWTSAHASSASVQRGNVRETVVNGIKSWSQMRSLKGTPPDDDNDDHTCKAQCTAEN